MCSGFRPSRCCFCIDVNLGTRIIAIVGMVLSALFILSNLATITFLGLVSGIVGILINALLYYGVKVQKPMYMLVWLVIQMIELVLLGIGVVGLIVAVILGKDILGTGGSREETLWATIISVVSALIMFCIYIHFWAVVWSCHQDIKERSCRNTGVV